MSETSKGQGEAEQLDITDVRPEMVGNASTNRLVGPEAKAMRQEFFLPVTGFVWLYPEELRVVDHPAVQRLGRIYQLGQTYLVYRGATHKRIEHVLGAVQLVQRMIEAVKHTSAKSQLRGNGCSAPLSPYEERFVRLGALLHDVGHIAAGHTVEDELRLTGKHDKDDRLDLLFSDADKNWVNGSGATLGELIDSEFADCVPPELANSDVSASAIVRLLIRKPPADQGEDRYLEQTQALETSRDIRLSLCRDMIGNTICADLLDYLHRDWYHLGKPRPFDERILQYMEIRPRKKHSDLGGLQASSDDDFVISLGERPKIRTDAVSAILELLEWRYQLAESVLFHRTKLAAAAMLDRALYELLSGEGDVDKFLLPLSDEEMLAACRQKAELLEKGKSRTGKERGRIANTILRQLQDRQLFTALCTFTVDDLPPDVQVKLQDKFAESDSAPSERNRVLRVLESDFKLEAGSLAMYCPTAHMNHKIAEVKIAVGERVAKFSDYEIQHHDQLSGGHLGAQMRRFGRLWRVHFFIERAQRARLHDDVRVLLVDAIERLALGHLRHDSGQNDVSRRFARQLILSEGSPWHGYELRSEADRAAYLGSSAATGLYPFGGDSILSYIKEKK